MLSSTNNERKKTREKTPRRRDNREIGLLTILEQIRRLMCVSIDQKKTKGAKKSSLDAKYDHVFVRNLHIFTSNFLSADLESRTPITVPLFVIALEKKV